MDFWLVLSKNDSNIICSSIKNESFLKIWRVWHILKVCHALWYLKIEMGIAGSIFELHPPNFQKMCIFWRFTNDISTIFCYLLWFQFWKKCQSLPVHPRVVPVLVHITTLIEFLKLTRKYPFRRYILGVLMHTTAWVKHRGSDGILKIVLIYAVWLSLD